MVLINVMVKVMVHMNAQGLTKPVENTAHPSAKVIPPVIEAVLGPTLSRNQPIGNAATYIHPSMSDLHIQSKPAIRRLMGHVSGWSGCTDIVDTAGYDEQEVESRILGFTSFVVGAT